MEMPARSAGLDPIVAEIIEAHARTMVDNDNNKQRRAPARRVQASGERLGTIHSNCTPSLPVLLLTFEFPFS